MLLRVFNNNIPKEEERGRLGREGKGRDGMGVGFHSCKKGARKQCGKQAGGGLDASSRWLDGLHPNVGRL